MSGKISLSLSLSLSLSTFTPKRRFPHTQGEEKVEYENRWWQDKLPSEKKLTRLESLFKPMVLPRDEETKSKTPYGDLSAIGMDQCFRMGQKLRERYWDDLKEKVSWNVFSSNYTRTQQSARCGLLGLFSDSQHDLERAMSSLSPGSLPTITVRRHEDDVIDMFNRHGAHMPARVQHIIERDRDVFKRKAKDLGLNRELMTKLVAEMPAYASPLAWFNIADTMLCVRSNRSTSEHSLLSESVLKYTDLTNEYIRWRFARYYEDPLMLRYAAGDLTSEMLMNMKQLQTNEDAVPCFWYSGHDVTIMPLLRALNIWDGTWAPYASYVAVELHHHAGDWEIRVVYNDNLLTTMPLAQWENCVKGIFEAADVHSSL